MTDKITNIREDFQKLNRIEKKYLSRKQDKFVVSTWLYRRVQVFSHLKIEQKKVNYFRRICQIFTELKSVQKLRNSKDIVFMSGRLLDGDDAFIPSSVYRNIDAAVYIYSQQDDVLPEGLPWATSIRSIRTLTATIALIMAPLLLLSPRFIKALTVHLKIEGSFIRSRPLRSLIRLSDFIFLALMFRLIINMSKVERVHFTSRSFFFPLIYTLPSHVVSNEYMHALVHPYHPAYSASWLQPDLRLFPTRVINTPLSIWPSNLSPINSKVMSFAGEHHVRCRPKLTIPKDLKLPKSLNICVIGQPFDMRFHLEKLLKWTNQFKTVSFIYCPHPREREDAIAYMLKELRDVELQQWSVAKERRDIDAIFGVGSNALVEANSLGYQVVIPEGYMSPVMKSLIPTCLVI